MYLYTSNKTTTKLATNCLISLISFGYACWLESPGNWSKNRLHNKGFDQFWSFLIFLKHNFAYIERPLYIVKNLLRIWTVQSLYLPVKERWSFWPFHFMETNDLFQTLYRFSIRMLTIKQFKIKKTEMGCWARTVTQLCTVARVWGDHGQRLMESFCFGLIPDTTHSLHQETHGRNSQHLPFVLIPIGQKICRVNCSGRAIKITFSSSQTKLVSPC